MIPSAHRASERTAASLASRFLDVLRVGDGPAADRLVDGALAAGMAPEAVQALVIGPAMVRIGDLWECRALTVADEHLATSISHRALFRVFAALSARRVEPRSRERVLLAAVEGQHHVLGLRMVADVLEGGGFDVLYLGADVPVDALGAFVAEHEPAVVGLGCSIIGDVGRLAESLWTIHADAPRTRIMLGGPGVPAVLHTVGYPLVASSLDVLTVVEGLIAGPPQSLPEVVDLLRSGDPAGAAPREHAVETDAIAGRLAKAADEAVDLARDHVRRAEKYRDLAYRDPLTGLPNRRGFEDELKAVMDDPSSRGAVLMIDVDSFKAVNDNGGHDEGDRVLRAIALAIGEAVRPDDVAARVGGDEFAVLLPATTVQEACVVGERVRSVIAGGAAAGVSVSVGAATASGDARAALLAADTALYQAKTSGRDRVIAAAPVVALRD